MRHPSGDQYEIDSGGSVAQISQVGATLRAFAVDGIDILDGFPSDERSTDGRGQVLVPWPNRLTDGRYSYGGRECQAPLNEPSRHDAIHGLVRWLDWSVVTHESDQVTLACTVRRQPAYEWQVDIEITYAVDVSGLTVTLVARNADNEPAPFGVGFHLPDPRNRNCRRPRPDRSRDSLSEPGCPRRYSTHGAGRQARSRTSRARGPSRRRSSIPHSARAHSWH